MESEGECDTVVVFSSALGWIALTTRRRKLRKLTFGWRGPRAAQAALGKDAHLVGEPDELARRLIARLQGFARGERDEFLDIPLDVRELTPFARRVVARCRHIQFGTTLTYAQLAARSGVPRAARAVGNVMARNRFPIVVPCHRVLASGGSLGGYSAPNGIRMKRRLLRLEGAL